MEKSAIIGGMVFYPRKIGEKQNKAQGRFWRFEEDRDMTLVIMAAGMGSRYGGLKQLDSLGNGGEFMVDFSIYDALQAGFDQIVFIIKEENYDLFVQTVGHRVEQQAKVQYVFQKLEDLPQGMSPAPGREKPWGTAQAVYACRHVVGENFAVINADDFYGRESFVQLAQFLRTAGDREGKASFCMAGFCLANTLTENGTVSRGVCSCSADGYLLDVTERTKIQRNNGVIQYFEPETGWVDLPEDAVASMNCWGFTPAVFQLIERGFQTFWHTCQANPLKAEYYLPTVIKESLAQGLCEVKVLPTGAKWFGVTYREDREAVAARLQEMQHNGTYPERLWQHG